MPLSTFLQGRAPTQLRGLQWLALTESGQVLSVTNTADDGGGVSQEWAAGSAVPCRIDPLCGGEEVTANRLSDESTHLVTVPAGTPRDGESAFRYHGPRDVRHHRGAGGDGRARPHVRGQQVLKRAGAAGAGWLPTRAVPTR